MERQGSNSLLCKGQQHTSHNVAFDVQQLESDTLRTVEVVGNQSVRLADRGLDRLNPTSVLGNT